MPSNASEYYRVRRANGSDPQFQRSPRRVHDLVRAAIRSGEFKPGDKLDERALIQQFSSSRNAVREALQILTDEGLLTRSPREGTTVVGTLVEMPIDDLIGEGLADRVSVDRLSNERVPSTSSMRAKLQTEALEVGAIEHLFKLDDQPVGVLINYYHAHVEQPLGWIGCPDMTTVFEEVYGTPVGWVETSIEARFCEPRTMRLLGLTERVPVLVREQVAYDADGRPHGLHYSHFLTDRISFKVQSRPAKIQHAATVLRIA